MQHNLPLIAQSRNIAMASSLQCNHNCWCLPLHPLGTQMMMPRGSRSMLQTELSQHRNEVFLRLNGKMFQHSPVTQKVKFKKKVLKAHDN